MALPLQSIFGIVANNISSNANDISAIGGCHFGQIETDASFTMPTDTSVICIEVTNSHATDAITITYAGLTGTNTAGTVAWVYGAALTSSLIAGETCIFIRPFCSTADKPMWIHGPITHA